MKKDSIVVTGGGTGGHLKVADSFIEELNNRGYNVIYIGSSNGQDKAWFEEDNRISQKFFLDTKGVVNKKFLGKIFSLLNIFSKTLQCIKIYYKFNVKKVISVGGYSAAAATFASILKPNCKLYIHEQNSKMGKLNEVTSKFASKLFSSFSEESMIKDYPVSKEFFDKARVRTEIKTVAFFGGSQGAIAINDFALKVAPKLNSLGIKIIHQAGKNDYERVKAQYDKLNINADVFGFTKDFLLKVQEADFAVSRAGASTLWEMCANCLPSFFIPYPYAAKDHQYYNAKVLKEKGLCFLQRESNLDEEEFFKAINCDIKNISTNLKNSIKPDAVSKILDIVLHDK